MDGVKLPTTLASCHVLDMTIGSRAAHMILFLTALLENVVMQTQVWLQILC